MYVHGQVIILSLSLVFIKRIVEHVLALTEYISLSLSCLNCPNSSASSDSSGDSDVSD